MVAVPEVCASPFKLEHSVMLAAVRKCGNNLIFASGLYDCGVYVKVPLVIDELERTLKADASCAAAQNRYDRDTARHRQAVACHVELYGDNVPQPENAQGRVATAAAGSIRAANWREEPVKAYRLAIDVELALDGAAIGIPGGGYDSVCDTEHKLAGSGNVRYREGPGNTSGDRGRVVGGQWWGIARDHNVAGTRNVKGQGAGVSIHQEVQVSRIPNHRKRSLAGVGGVIVWTHNQD